jgi:hypothetical protein
MPPRTSAQPCMHTRAHTHARTHTDTHDTHTHTAHESVRTQTRTNTFAHTHSTRAHTCTHTRMRTRACEFAGREGRRCQGPFRSSTCALRESQQHVQQHGREAGVRRAAQYPTSWSRMPPLYRAVPLGTVPARRRQCPAGPGFPQRSPCPLTAAPAATAPPPPPPLHARGRKSAKFNMLRQAKMLELAK